MANKPETGRAKWRIGLEVWWLSWWVRPASWWAKWRIGLVVVLGLAVIWAVLWPLTDTLAAHDIGTITGSARVLRLGSAREAVRTQLLTLGAGLAAAAALVFTARNFSLSRQGQVADRYTKAIEQLGSDKLDVRIGAIYSLERIAHDSRTDHPTVMEVLTAFVREHSREQWPLQEPEAAGPVPLIRPDVEAAVTVIGRRNPDQDKRPIDLRGANLPGVNLRGVSLDGAIMVLADLAGADLARADLGRALLISTNLSRANLERADLRRAVLSDANLTNANLSQTLLFDADLRHAVMSDANLSEAALIDANVADAQFDGADLSGAIWPEGHQIPGGWSAGPRTGRLIRGDSSRKV